MAYAVREVGFSVSGSGPQNPGLPAHQIPGAAIKRIGLVTTIWACWLHAWAFSVLRHGRRRTLVPTFFALFLTAREPWVIWLQLRQPVGLPLGPVFSCGQRRPLWPADAPIGLLLLAAFSIASAVLVSRRMFASDWIFCSAVRASCTSTGIPSGQGAWL